MLPPDFFRDARMAAPHFIQARVLGWTGLLNIKVTRVFRGDLKRGAQLTLRVHIDPGFQQLGDPTLWVDMEVVKSARYVEVFLDGDPLAVVCDQIKYLQVAGRRPSGDPAQISFIW
jgi:hypothetical protein